MTYRQAKQIVLKKYPTAVLAAMRTVRKKIQTWSDNEAQRKLETKSVVNDYYILGPNGRDLCSGVRSQTKAPAWIKAAEMIDCRIKPEPEAVVKRYPLHQSFMKRERTKQQRLSQGRKKWYYRGIGYKKPTEAKLEVS